jgi:hypothetical protein
MRSSGQERDTGDFAAEIGILQLLQGQKLRRSVATFSLVSSGPTFELSVYYWSITISITFLPGGAAVAARGPMRTRAPEPEGSRPATLPANLSTAAFNWREDDGRRSGPPSAQRSVEEFDRGQDRGWRIHGVWGQGCDRRGGIQERPGNATSTNSTLFISPWPGPTPLIAHPDTSGYAPPGGQPCLSGQPCL